MAGPAPVYASRGDGRTYTAADRRRSGKTSIPGGLTNGHLKLHPNLHQLDGRSPDYAFESSIMPLDSRRLGQKTAGTILNQQPARCSCVNPGLEARPPQPLLGTSDRDRD